MPIHIRIENMTPSSYFMIHLAQGFVYILTQSFYDTKVVLSNLYLKTALKGIRSVKSTFLAGYWIYFPLGG